MEYNFLEQEQKSKFHKQVIAFLRQEFSLFHIIQEFPISIEGKNLFCDIFCKSPIKFIIEINSRIHYKFIPLFHGTYDRFLEFQKNDQLKKKWADMNDYLFIILREEDFKSDKQFQVKLRKILK